MVQRRVRIYADVENTPGIPPQILKQHVSQNIGTPSGSLAFLAERSRQIFEQKWRDAGFDIHVCEDGLDAADRLLITTIIHDIQQDRENGHPSGTIVLVSGDGIYKDVLKVAQRLGWHIVIIWWKRKISEALIDAAQDSIDLATVME